MTLQAHNVTGIYGGETYLITSDHNAILVDSGYGFGTDRTVANIETQLGDRELSAIILSHSHYDHVMGSPAISEHFPKVPIYAHPIVKQIFQKPNARKTMEQMNQAAAGERNMTAQPGQADKLKVDETLTDGDKINLSDMTITTIETPGHTKCSISLLIEEPASPESANSNNTLLFAGETLGVALDFPEVIPGFIVDYQDAINSIEKVKKLQPQKVLLPHGHVIEGKDVDIYFENGIKEIKKMLDIITTAHKAGSSVEQIVEQLKDIYYHGTFKKFQPDEAYYANFTAMVTKVIEKENL